TDIVLVLLGQTADRILPISATELVRAYTDSYVAMPVTVMPMGISSLQNLGP
ncbi:hypothetical protein LINPERHAP1_LOCUS29672, partial [Linum perenne]